MAESFDPYLHWLGIRDAQRPPNHYRLLGVAIYESDPEVLLNAADRQMSHVRTFQSGKHSDESQKLLNEIATAKVCLLNAEKKTVYDSQLRAAEEPPQAILVAPPPPPPPLELAEPPIVAPPALPDLPRGLPPLSGVTLSVPPMGRSSSPAPYLIALFVVLMASLLGLAVLLTSQGRPKEKALDDIAPGKPPAVQPRPVPLPEPQPKPQPVPQPKPRPKPQPAPQAKPVPQPQPRPEEVPSASKSLASARSAMQSRNLGGAARHLELARKAAEPADMKEIDRLQTLLDDLRGFWTAVLKEIGTLKPGDRLSVAGRELEVLESQGGELLLANGDARQRFALTSLPLEIVRVIIEKNPPADADKLELQQAVVMLFDREGNAGQAKQLCDRAAARGLPVAPLLAELASRSTPAEKPAEKPTGSPQPQPAHPPEDRRLAVPEADALAGMLKEIRDVFKDRYAAARDRDQKRTFARFLAQQAVETPDKPAARYMLLSEARDMAAAAGDANLLSNVIATMGREFKLDSQAMIADTIIKAAKKPRDNAANQSLARLALDLAQNSLRRGDNETATLLTEAAREMARKARDGTTVKQAAALAKEIQERKQLAEAFAEAEKNLADKPDDPEANQTAAEYYCLIKNDWSRGLAMLSKGADETLKGLAQAEAGGAPGTPAEMVVLGDRWYDAADAAANPVQRLIRARAAYWYQRALPSLTGLTQGKVKRRLTELTEQGR